MRSSIALITILIACLVMPGQTFSQQPAIDGNFTEWQAANQVATDPAGDATGAFDISTVSAITSGSVLHLNFDIGKTINLQNGPETEGTLKLIIGAEGKQLTVDFRARTVTDGVKKHIGWDKVGFQCLPTFASDKYEMRLDLGLLGVAAGDTVSIQFAGSDQLD